MAVAGLGNERSFPAGGLGALGAWALGIEGLGSELNVLA